MLGFIVCPLMYAGKYPFVIEKNMCSLSWRASPHISSSWLLVFILSISFSHFLFLLVFITLRVEYYNLQGFFPTHGNHTAYSLTNR